MDVTMDNFGNTYGRTVSFMGAVSGIILTSIALWTSRHRALDMNSSIAGVYLVAIAISMF